MKLRLLEKIKRDLNLNEEIIWFDKPNPHKHFNSSDIFLVPFSFLWFGFALFWEGTALFMIPKDKSIGLLFPLYGLFFVFIGFYFAIGRFLYKYKKNQNTLFLITNKRVIVSSSFPKYSIKSEFITDLKAVNKSDESNEFGTITFGEINPMFAMYRNSGMDFFGNAYGNTGLAFYNIKNVQTVYKQILQLKERLSS